MPSSNLATDDLTDDSNIDISDLWETPADSPVISSTEEIEEALQAHASDALIPIGVSHVCQSSTIQSTDTKEMSASFTILTRPKKNELNRGGRMVQIAPGPLGEGMKTENYQKNPVVLFNHGMEGFVFPVGLSQDKNGKCTIKANARQMSGKVYFKQSCPYAESVFQMIDDGLLRMSSAGFSVEQMVMLDLESKLPQGVYTPLQVSGQRAFDCTQSDLMEWSIVPIGADAGALRQCVETGKHNGHKIRPQLIPVLRQYAEKPQAWGIGFGGGMIHQPQGQSYSNAITQAAPIPAYEFHKALGDAVERFRVIVQESLDQQRESIRQQADEFSKQQAVAMREEFEAGRVNFATIRQQAKTPSTQPEENPVQQSAVVTQQPVIQQLNIAAVGEQIGSMVSQAVAAALKPTQEAQQKLSDRIAQITGKLPD